MCSNVDWRERDASEIAVLTAPRESPLDVKAPQTSGRTWMLLLDDEHLQFCIVQQSTRSEDPQQREEPHTHISTITDSEQFQ